MIHQREKELSILDRTRTCLNTAEALLRENPSLAGFRDWLDVAAVVTPKARGVQTEIDTTFNWTKAFDRLRSLFNSSDICDISDKPIYHSVSESSSQKTRHFYPPDEPIRPHLLCFEGFAVPGVQLHPPRLASSAASTREYARLERPEDIESDPQVSLA